VIGSIVVTLAFGAVYIKYVLKTPPLPLLDAAAFTLPLSIGLGRFGCLLNGCCFGMLAPDWARTPLLRAFTIPLHLYAPTSFAGQTLKGTLPGDALLWNLPLLLMFHEAAVLAVTETLYRHRERWRLLPGTVLAAAVAQEAGGRFFLEFLRWDEHVGGTVFNPWQLSVAAIFLVSFALLSGRLARRARPA
jgi:prolipoprotein diacylglyceryltransferase